MMSFKVVQDVVLGTHLANVVLMVRLATSVVRRITFQECMVSWPRKVIHSLQRGQWLKLS